jgi:type VI secretion system protein ImpL
VLSFLKRRAFVVTIGLLLVAIFIWYAGPYFAFADYRPLETGIARLIAISLVVVCWVVSVLLKWLRAIRASDKLAGAVLGQSPREKERPSAEATKLRERFEEAVATLKQQRRSGNSLYDLPWYVFIGAPGSGKTTALLNSGLKFPLEQRVGRGAVRGVGGTRNCDWWFTGEAVFLDTAGRYTTQDSDARSDSEGWREFLALLRTYRKRRPLNGIVLTISAQDLLTAGDVDREAHVDAARRRLNEITRELHIQLPVYLMVTKCDMVPGFTEYFDDLTQEGRAQVWGVTFPYEQTVNGDAPDAFAPEFDTLMARLNARLFARLEEERGARRRATIFAFPQQMTALRDLLAQFVGDVFSSTHVDQQILLLRGVYFTSGTQDGTQIDRLLGAIGRRFGVAPEIVAPPAGRGKAYFVERLLKNVVIAESGLAGVNRRLEIRQAAWQIGAYAATLLVVVGGLLALSMSYANNRAYVGQVASDVATLRQVRPAVAATSLEGFLPYLNAVRAVSDSASRYRGDTRWGMRWGLYQGTSVGNAARDAYLRELDSILLPRFAARVRQHLIDYASEPEKLYVYLKAYLMLGDPRHLDKKHLQFLADLEWNPETAGRADTSLATHFRSLLEYSDTLRPIAIDPPLVAQARSSIRQASIPQIMYSQLRRSYSGDTADAPRFDLIAGIGIEKVFRRKSGRRLSEPVPALYTRKVFKEVTGAGMLPLVKQFADDEWVWGTGSVVSAASWPRLTAQVTDLYARDYSNTWDAILSDLEVASFPTVQQYADALGILVGPTSPLRGILRTVVENTTLVASSSEAGAPPAAAPSLGTRITEGARDIFNSARQKITGGVPPGTLITEHFQPIHRLMAGQPAPIDGTFEQIRKIRDQLLKLGPQAGGEQPLRALSDPAVRDLLRSLKQDAANLPSPVNALIGEIADKAEKGVSTDATLEVENLYRQEVVAPCLLRVEGHYPFGSASEMPLVTFADVFGYGGLYDKFFTDNLAKLVDTTQHPWAWREGSVYPSSGVLRQFERAERIRQIFFSPGSKTPQLNFFVRLSDLDRLATRFYVNIDGQQFDTRPGFESRNPAVWPGPVPEKRGTAFLAFEDRVAAPEQARRFQGPWALFRLIDETAIPSARAQNETDLNSVLRIQTKYHQAQVIIESSNAASNPFTAHDWRQFKCDP